jgi:hypothetical protein
MRHVEEVWKRNTLLKLQDPLCLATVLCCFAFKSIFQIASEVRVQYQFVPVGAAVQRLIGVTGVSL